MPPTERAGEDYNDHPAFSTTALVMDSRVTRPVKIANAKARPVQVAGRVSDQRGIVAIPAHSPARTRFSSTHTSASFHAWVTVLPNH